jgi:hypothetical protein
MSQYVDRMLVTLSTPTGFTDLLAPAADATQSRLRALLNAVYDLSFATLHSIPSVTLESLEYQQPFFPPHRTTGNWTQIQPGYTLTDVFLNEETPSLPAWLDLSARVGLTLILEVDTGNIASILTPQISGFTTLADFRSRFRFIDLDAFMAKHSLTTVDDLREAFQYLLTEIRLQTPPIFNPADPANQHRYQLNIAVLIRDTFDLADSLRAAKLTRAMLERTLTYRGEVPTAEVRSPYAILVLFPANSVPAAGPSEAQAQAVFAAERILALFVSPP